MFSRSSVTFVFLICILLVLAQLHEVVAEAVRAEEIDPVAVKVEAVEVVVAVEAVEVDHGKVVQLADEAEAVCNNHEIQKSRFPPAKVYRDNSISAHE